MPAELRHYRFRNIAVLFKGESGIFKLWNHAQRSARAEPLQFAGLYTRSLIIRKILHGILERHFALSDKRINRVNQFMNGIALRIGGFFRESDEQMRHPYLTAGRAGIIQPYQVITKLGAYRVA